MALATAVRHAWTTSTHDRLRDGAFTDISPCPVHRHRAERCGLEGPSGWKQRPGGNTLRRSADTAAEGSHPAVRFRRRRARTGKTTGCDGAPAASVGVEPEADHCIAAPG